MHLEPESPYQTPPRHISGPGGTNLCAPAPKSRANCLIINNGMFQVNFTKRQRVGVYLMKSLALPGVPIAALHFNNAHPSTIPPPSLHQPSSIPPATIQHPSSNSAALSFLANLSRQHLFRRHLFRRRRIISVASMPRLGPAYGVPGGVMWRGERENFKKILKKFAE